MQFLVERFFPLSSQFKIILVPISKKAFKFERTGFFLSYDIDHLIQKIVFMSYLVSSRKLKFEKKSKQLGWRYTFLKTPSNFSFFYFTPWNSRQNKAQTLDIPQNCVRSFGNFKAKNKNPWKFHINYFFLANIGNSTLLLINRCKIPHASPGNFISSTLPV